MCCVTLGTFKRCTALMGKVGEGLEGGGGEGHNKSPPLLALDKVPDFEQPLFLTVLLSELGFCVGLTIGNRC